METAASISKRAKIRCRKIAQKIIMDHFRIISGKPLWKSHYHLNRKNVPMSYRIAWVPSPEAYDEFVDDLEKHNGRIQILRDSGGYLLVPTLDGYLLLNDTNDELGFKRFKARRDFGKYLLRVRLLLLERPKYENILVQEKRKANVGNYSYQTIRDRSTTTIRFCDTTNDCAVLKDRNSHRVIGVRNATKLFVDKYWDGNYEEFKKFKQRVRKDKLI
jgi:hypothetical protein